MTLLTVLAPGGVATFFGVSSSTITDTITTAGQLGAQGASILPLVVAITTSGVPTKFTASTTALSFNSTTAGTLGAFSVSTLGLAGSFTTSGTRDTFGVSTTPVAFNSVGVGQLSAFGVNTATFTVTFATDGVDAAAAGVPVVIAWAGPGWPQARQHNSAINYPAPLPPTLGGTLQNNDGTGWD